jgi:hypothetical protein
VTGAPTALAGRRELATPLLRRRSLGARLATGALIAFLVFVVALSFGVRSSPASIAGSVPASTSPIDSIAHPAVAASDEGGDVTAATQSAIETSLDLSVSATPSSICVAQTTTCPAGVGLSRVTLTASAATVGYQTWPAVQVAFVIETTVYDGVYDPTAGTPGYDECAIADDPAGGACEESNGVPFFINNAQAIANSISAANPHTTVSFALVDYFATLDQQDDGDGSEYHVDIPQFVPAGNFGSDVQATIGSQYPFESGNRYEDSDFSDNILHSSSITALYGTIIGSGLDWANNTHHVIVWMGDTAPRDPSYEQDYCVSPSEYYHPGGPESLPCMSSGCEPAYAFGTGSSPACEGWINSQNGNASDSIAALAHQSPSCTDSIGGDCTLDMIDLWSTTTDPESPGWPAGDATAALGGGPNGPMVEQNVGRVLLAGCDMAAATGGTWDGPSFFSCPNGQTGTLQPEFLGPFGEPNLNNPSLFAAFRSIGFGPIQSDVVATATNHPLFQFVPYGSIEMLPGAEAQIRTVCETGTGALSPHCPTQPTTLNVALGPGQNVTVYGWNWSSIYTDNQMVGGDTWIASFWVQAAGPPYGTVPVDACVTTDCSLGGSRSLNGFYTSATYLPAVSITVVTESFPLATLDVEAPPSSVPPPTLPPAPPPVPPPALPPPPGLPLLTTIGVGAQVGIASLSLNAAAAGFVAAGFGTITVRNKPLSLQVAQLRGKQSPVRSRFEADSASKAPVGHFE